MSEDVKQYHRIFLRILVLLLAEYVQHQWNVVLRSYEVSDDLYDLLDLPSRIRDVLGLLRNSHQRFEDDLCVFADVLLTDEQRVLELVECLGLGLVGVRELRDLADALIWG